MTITVIESIFESVELNAKIVLMITNGNQSGE